MKSALFAGLAGLLFGLGLVVSGMTDANKVIAFLDLGGQWDPSLAFVMVGAIGIHFVLYRLILQRPSPLLASDFGLPTSNVIDGRLVAGASLFGLGWGLAGYCPGPAVVSATSLDPKALLFLGSMASAMWLFGILDRSAEQDMPGPKGASHA